MHMYPWEILLDAFEREKSCIQCSPYQAVTGKIYRLKQHFLLPATA